ncbi:MAG: shikimate dehydrogenase [Crenarchaeota archaeon]|nr:shikimate dehydrogenase [Thermoproteota archaeon]
MFAVIGHPIAHSLSPVLHRIGFEILGVEAEYLKVDVPPEKLDDFMRAAPLIFRGINVTIPHKVRAAELVDELDPVARRVGAVNVIDFKDKSVGYNTDVAGIRVSVEEVVDPKGLRIAILGAGGAARAAVVAFMDDAHVTIFNRTPERARELARLFGVEARSLSEVGEIRKHDVVINATPVGMDGSSSPVPPEALTKGQVVVDMIYRPLYTPLLKMARERGAVAVNGLKMLVVQGVESERIWLGRAPPWREVYRRLLEELAKRSF